jgi:hypothetical protein
MNLILAPLRGVTIRCFRRTFAPLLADGGFTEAVTPFITATAGFDPLKDRELRGADGSSRAALTVTPQFIGKDPAALRFCLARVREAGFSTADLNCGCPFPMVRNKGRGSGLLRTPDLLCRLIEAGCETMGPGRFSIKVRLGVDRPDELLSLLPLLERFPLRFLTVHARTARQMYDGACDMSMFARIAALARVPVVRNGDLPFPPPPLDGPLMIGRGFIRALGRRADCDVWLARYLEASRAELSGERPVLGRLKELIAYWKDEPAWRRRWQLVKIARSLPELTDALAAGRVET